MPHESADVDTVLLSFLAECIARHPGKPVNVVLNIGCGHVPNMEKARALSRFTKKDFECLTADPSIAVCLKGATETDFQKMYFTEEERSLLRRAIWGSSDSMTRGLSYKIVMDEWSYPPSSECFRESAQQYPSICRWFVEQKEELVVINVDLLSFSQEVKIERMILALAELTQDEFVELERHIQESVTETLSRELKKSAWYLNFATPQNYKEVLFSKKQCNDLLDILSSLPNIPEKIKGRMQGVETSQCIRLSRVSDCDFCAEVIGTFFRKAQQGMFIVFDYRLPFAKGDAMRSYIPIVQAFFDKYYSRLLLGTYCNSIDFGRLHFFLDKHSSAQQPTFNVCNFSQMESLRRLSVTFEECLQALGFSDAQVQLFVSEVCSEQPINEVCSEQPINLRFFSPRDIRFNFQDAPQQLSEGKNTLSDVFTKKEHTFISDLLAWREFILEKLPEIDRKDLYEILSDAGAIRCLVFYGHRLSGIKKLLTMSTDNDYESRRRDSFNQELELFVYSERLSGLLKQMFELNPPVIRFFQPIVSVNWSKFT